VSIQPCNVLFAIVLAALALPSLADDCTAVRAAILQSGHSPKSSTTTKTDGQGKKVVTRSVQTLTNKYVQTEDGKWYAMGIAIKDLDDDTSAKLTCRRSGSDSLGGQSVAIYEVHMDLDGNVSDNKYWVSPANLILKSEALIEGARYTTEYDFVHVAPPANATPMGGN